jgi:hypothetical protein
MTKLEATSRRSRSKPHWTGDRSALGLVMLALVVAAAAGPAAAQNSIRPGQKLTGLLASSDPKLDDDSHYDCFTLQTRRGQTLQIDQTSDAFDSFIQIGTGGCDAFQHQQSDDDSGGGLNSRLVIEGNGDLLTIRVNSLQADQTGLYQLGVSLIGQSAGGISPSVSDPFNAPAIFLAAAGNDVFFGLPIEEQTNGIRIFPVLAMFREGTPYSKDENGRDILVSAQLSDYSIDCRQGTFFASNGVGYSDQEVVFSVVTDGGYRTPTQGTLPSEAVRVACNPDGHDWGRAYTTHEAKLARLRPAS